MANSDKDILITPNIGQAAVPEIKFVGSGASPRYIKALDDNTLSFQNNAGTERFSINEDLIRTSLSASGNFRVNNSSGTSLLQVTNSTNLVDLVNTGTGYVQVGGAFGSLAGTYKLDVVGGIRSSTKLVTQNGTSADWDSTEIFSNGVESTLNARGAEYGWNLQFDGTERIRVETTGKTKLGSINRNITTDSKMTSLMVRGGSYTATMGTSTAALKLFPADGGPLSSARANKYNSGIAFQHLDPNYSGWGEAYAGSQAWIGLYTYDTPGQERDYLVFGTNSDTTAGSEPTARLSISPFGDVYIGNSSFGTTYKLNVSGDINFTGNLYKNGSLFQTLPTQSASTIGAVLMSNGTNAFWDSTASWTATFADGSSSSTVTTLPYAAEDRYRVGFQITRGYAMGGYQNSTSYRNVCSINHGTITLQNHGDLLTNGQGYCAGGRNASMYGYVFIAVNGVGGTGSTCSKINMNNNTNSGTVSISISRSSTTIMQRDFKYAYVYGGGDARPDRFNYANDTSALIANGNPEGNVNNPAGGYGATYGWTKNGSGYNFSWAAETYAVWPNPPGTDGTNKTLSARHGFAYWNTAGGYTTAANLSKRSLVTGAEANQVFKFNSGEETWHTGISKGFMCGMYNGAQNNTGVVVDYAAETFVANSNINRVGPPGSASGAGTEFGTLLSGYDGI